MVNRFALAYREQQQLFIYDKTYLCGTLFEVGGLATLLARFIEQFFWNPKVAMAITMVLLALSAYMLWVVARESRKDWKIIPLCIIPALFLYSSLSDNGLHFDYFISILLVQAGLILFKDIRSRRLFWGMLLTVILYFTAGPAAILFAVAAVIFSYDKVKARVLLLPLVAVICALAAYFISAVPSFREAFTPAFHYALDAKMPAFHWTCWVSLPLIVLLCVAASKLNLKKLIVFVSGLILAVLTLIPAGKFSKTIGKDLPNLACIFEYYTNKEDWDGLIEACKKAPWLPRTANYLNMALAWKGELAEHLLDYDQRGTQALVMISEDRAVDVAQAHIMFTMGNVAASQDVSFNSLASVHGYCPAMVKLNAQVELMRGSYGVADKYISLLEKTLHYRKWAKEYRRFLYDDEAVEADPLLGNGRRNLTAKNAFVMYTNPMAELFPILDANPNDKRALEYGLCYLLLAKDLNSVKHFITDYYSSPDSPALPRIAQEAMVFYSEYSRNMEGIEPFDLDWCYEHGVEPETVKHFEEYQRAAMAGPESLKRFRGTYWYYLVHPEI
jgi:hypothetical protein